MTIYLKNILHETEDNLILISKSFTNDVISRLVKVGSDERYPCDLCTMKGKDGVQCNAYVCVGSSRYLRLCDLHKYKPKGFKYYYFSKDYTKMTLKNKNKLSLYESAWILNFIKAL